MSQIEVIQPIMAAKPQGYKSEANVYLVSAVVKQR